MHAGAALSGLVPHQGAMCLLESVLRWDAAGIVCRAVSHLDPANPLRAAGRLGVVCGIEYGLQAAAAHGALRGEALRGGALRGGGPAAPGWFAALREAELLTDRLDRPEFGALEVSATLEAGGAGGMIYRFALHAADGRPLLRGRATIALPPGAPPAATTAAAPTPP
jgi:predicted hotdog family 3-hydroxylacyl-ACP dehydratase